MILCFSDAQMMLIWIILGDTMVLDHLDVWKLILLSYYQGNPFQKSNPNSFLLAGIVEKRLNISLIAEGRIVREIILTHPAKFGTPETPLNWDTGDVGRPSSTNTRHI